MRFTGHDREMIREQSLLPIGANIFDTGGLCLSCDTAGHGKGYKTVSSSFRCLAVDMILAMYGIKAISPMVPIGHSKEGRIG